jgi:hypothetical protein
MATSTMEPQIKLSQLPARDLGFKNAPAFPIDVAGMLDTLFRLSIRFKHREQALQGLSKTYTIGGKTARAYDFLIGHASLEAKEQAQLQALREQLGHNTLEIVPTIVEIIASQTKSAATPGGELTQLPLDDPRQFSVSWTTFPMSSPWGRRVWMSGQRPWTCRSQRRPPRPSGR